MTRRSLPLLSAAGVWLVLCVSAQAAGTTPQPPPQLCIGDPAKCVTAPAPGGAIKWHPGHYMMLRNGHNYDTVDQSYIKQLANEPTVVGVLRDWTWRNLESSKGVYDFSTIDTYLSTIKSLPGQKRFIIRVENRTFGAATSTAVPDYITSDPTYLGGQAVMTNGVTARIWDAVVMDRYIALIQALAQRYDADPNVEGISTSETAIGFSATTPAPATYSAAALVTQLQRYAAAARQAWSHSNVFVETNYLGTDQQMQSLISTAVDDSAVVGGPDTVPGRVIQSDQVVQGVSGTKTDYRGNVAVKSEVQLPELGQKWTFMPADLYNLAYNTNHANFLLWDRNDYYGTAAQQWATGILPFIRSVNGKTYTACPRSYTGGCNSN